MGILKKRIASGATSYKQWWNQAGRTLDSAYAATISPQTEDEYRLRGWHGDPNSYGAKHFIEKAGLSSSSKVLEIGCGIARIGRELAPHVAQWHGADISSNMISHAKERCGHLPNVHFHELENVYSLRELSGGEFDFVYSTIVLMHLDKEDLLEYLCQAFRLLKKGGSAYFDTWNILHPDTLRIWKEGMKLGDEKPRGRIQCSTPDELAVYLRHAGFDVVQLDHGCRLARAFCVKGTESPVPLQDDHLPPYGYISNPVFGQSVNGLTEVTGFVLDRVASVEVFVDEQCLGSAQLRETNRGVQKRFSAITTLPELFGFQIEFDTTRYSNGCHEMRVIAKDSNGEESLLSGVSHIFKIEN
jgi:SAM-dependent methyltransferase